jgi:hypothetical protein
MTISFANNNTQITLTESSTGATAIIIDMIFDWCILENNTSLSDNELIDVLQAYYEEQANN